MRKCVGFGPTQSQIESYQAQGRAEGLDEQIAALTGPVIELDQGTARLPGFTEEVQRGALLLDEQKPGWWRTIDTSALDLAHEEMCVIGQAWSHYDLGSLLMFGGAVDRDMLAAHGFSISDLHGRMLNYQTDWDERRSPEVWRAAWERLTYSWLHEIRIRQDQAAVTGEAGSAPQESTPLICTP